MTTGRRTTVLRGANWPGAGTRLCGLVGDPVAHSLSPRLHNAAYAALGSDFAFAAFRVPEGELAAVIAGCRVLGFVGLAVTTPHKDEAARSADGRSEVVKRLGAANTVRFAAGEAIAENTDGEGLLADLALACDFRPEGRRCVVLGAGGAARAVVLALAEAGAAEVLVVNRTAERGVTAAALAGDLGRVAPVEEIALADLVVNATSTGLHLDDAAAADASRAFGERLGVGQLAVELVYDPIATPFLDAARRNGATGRNGLGMLVHQAARQVELFTGEVAPLESMWAAVGDYRERNAAQL